MLEAITSNWDLVLKIIWINILLSGDNAVVIALACRSLPPKQRMMGVILGAGAAIVLRIIFTMMTTWLMDTPWLKAIGSVLLLWIAVKLLVPEEHSEDSIAAKDSIWGAVQTIAVADVVMSLDNVIAIAAAAKGSMPLIIFGLIISVPLVVFGSTLLLKVIDRFPLLVWAGAALLGWIAGEIFVEDKGIQGLVGHLPEMPFAIGGALLVVALGYFLRRRHGIAFDGSTTG
jgi:YjbE family integral membrane protein